MPDTTLKHKVRKKGYTDTNTRGKNTKTLYKTWKIDTPNSPFKSYKRTKVDIIRKEIPDIYDPLSKKATLGTQLCCLVTPSVAPSKTLEQRVQRRFTKHLHGFAHILILKGCTTENCRVLSWGVQAYSQTIVRYYKLAFGIVDMITIDCFHF